MTRRVVTVEQLEALAADYAAPADPPRAEPRPPEASAPRGSPPPPASLAAVERCRKYLRKVPPSVEGQHGSDRAFQAARVIWNDFGIDEPDGYILLQEFNLGSVPAWPEDGKQGLRRKWDEAVKKGPGPEGRGFKLRIDRPGYSPRPTPAANGHANGKVGVDYSKKDSAPATGGLTPPDGGPVSPDPRAKPPLPLVYYQDIAPALDAADFVEGLLIDGAMSVIYGESGCGKTFFTLDLALHVASGTPWRGREVDLRGVLYLALEGSHGIRNRVAAYKIHANAAELPFAVVPVALNLLHPEGDTGRVIAAAKEAAARLTIPIGLIVVDTLSRAMAGGNENSPEDMGALVRHLDLIRQALPSHVSVIHHSGKDSARGARGHSSLRAATDTEVEITREPGTKTSTARVTKQRELELGDEFPFELVPVTLGTNRRGKEVTSCVVRWADAGPAPATAAERKEEQEYQRELIQEKKDEDRVLAAIRAECGGAEAPPAASVSAIRGWAKMRLDKVERVVKRLLERGEVVAVKNYQTRGGNGAMATVEEGYAPRPEKADLMSD